MHLTSCLHAAAGLHRGLGRARRFSSVSDADADQSSYLRGSGKPAGKEAQVDLIARFRQIGRKDTSPHLPNDHGHAPDAPLVMFLYC